jgi:hypothetical protein
VAQRSDVDAFAEFLEGHAVRLLETPSPILELRARFRNGAGSFERLETCVAELANRAVALLYVASPYLAFFSRRSQLPSARNDQKAIQLAIKDSETLDDQKGIVASMPRVSDELLETAWAARRFDIQEQRDAEIESLPPRSLTTSLAGLSLQEKNQIYVVPSGSRIVTTPPPMAFGLNALEGRIVRFDNLLLALEGFDNPPPAAASALQLEPHVFAFADSTAYGTSAAHHPLAYHAITFGNVQRLRFGLAPHDATPPEPILFGNFENFDFLASLNVQGFEWDRGEIVQLAMRVRSLAFNAERFSHAFLLGHSMDFTQSMVVKQTTLDHTLFVALGLALAMSEIGAVGFRVRVEGQTQSVIDALRKCVELGASKGVRGMLFSEACAMACLL